MALAARIDRPPPRLRLVQGEAHASGRIRTRKHADPEDGAGPEDGTVHENGSVHQNGSVHEKSSGPENDRREESAEALDDGRLVALAGAGDAAAFEALYRRHSQYAMALGVRVQGSPADIEDIVHDAFLRVHDRLDSLRSGASFRPWLASVVVSLVRTRLRRRRMLTFLGVMSADPIDLDSLVTHDAGPEVRAQLAQVYSVLREVDVDQSICWTLRYIEGRKLEEVAEIAQCSLATAKRRIAAVQERIALLDSLWAPESQRTVPVAKGSADD